VKNDGSVMVLNGVPHLECSRANGRNYECDLALLLSVVALQRASEDCAGSSRLQGIPCMNVAGQVLEGRERPSRHGEIFCDAPSFHIVWCRVVGCERSQRGSKMGQRRGREAR
jgi:hypothetical protein